MATVDFTILEDGNATTVPATVEGDTVRLASEALQHSLGWQIKPEGICRDDICMPVRDPHLVTDAGVDLAGFCALQARPLAVDVAEHAAAVGASAGDRSTALQSLEAPDFTLSDLDGKKHSLSDYRGKKVLLIAYASW